MFYFKFNIQNEIEINVQCRVSDKLTEDDFRGSQTIEDELEALRSSSHLSAMKRIERGRGTDRSAEPRVGLRSVYSCCCE